MTEQEKKEARQAAARRIMGKMATNLPGFVNTHQYGKFPYVPIAIQETLLAMLTADTGGYTFEIRHFEIVGGTLYVVHGVLRFINPANGLPVELHGIGAEEADGKQKASMIVPKAKSAAFKNAISGFAPCFGQDLRRKDEYTKAGAALPTLRAIYNELNPQ